MRQAFPLPSFEKSFHRLKSSDRIVVKKSLKQFNHLLLTGEAPRGLGFKKLAPGKYEFRAGIKLRVILMREDENYFLLYIADHDDVRRFLRNSP